MNATERMARFIVETRLDDVPESVVEAAKRAVLDTVGVTLAGTVEPVGEKVTGYLREMGCAGQATVLGVDFRTTVSWAALANGAFGHALDYDDQNWQLHGHGSVAVLPAVLAQAEFQGASGREVLEAFIVGFEVAAKLGAGMNMVHYYNGWHATSTLGGMGAAAATAHLRRLDVESTRLALGVAASHVSGIRANFGTMTKPLHAGLAAEAGVRAAALAARGLTANPQVLEASGGFCEVFCGKGTFRLEDIVGGLGEPYCFKEPGNNLKPYPCCISAHAPVDALRDLMEEKGLRAEDVESIDVGLVEISTKNLSYHRPKTALEGKFSAEYCMARMLLDGALRLETFTDAAVNNVTVQSLIKKIHVRVADEIDWEPGTTRPAIVTVHTTDGRTLTRRTEASRGNAGWPMTKEEVLDKFRDCAGVRLGPARLEEVVAQLNHLETLADIRPLMSLLA